MKKAFIVLFFSFFAHSSTTAQKIDFGAIEKYWQITDSLRQNIPINSNSWNSLLSMEGMKLYFQNQNQDLGMDAFRRSIEIVYMPKNDSILKARLKEPEKYYKAALLNEYKVNEQQIKEYISGIKKSPNQYLKTAYKNAYTMLPAKFQKRTTNSVIYLIPIFNDAVAENNDIISSIFALYFFDKLKEGALIGHELHHLLRPTKSIKSEKDKFLYEAIQQVIHEGSADLIDKKITESPNTHDWIRYSEYMLSSFEKPIEKLGEGIENHINGSKLITSKNINSIVEMSGHIPGYLMALIIERNGLKQEIIKNIDNPAEFFSTYNRAAKIDKEKPYVFSEKVISYLKSLK